MVKANWPSLDVESRRMKPVAALERVTTAPGTTASSGSNTAPLRRALTASPCPQIEQDSKHETAAQRTMARKPREGTITVPLSFWEVYHLFEGTTRAWSVGELRESHRRSGTYFLFAETVKTVRDRPRA